MTNEDKTIGIFIPFETVECARQGIDVLDHVVIGDGRYVSLKDEGIIR